MHYYYYYYHYYCYYCYYYYYFTSERQSRSGETRSRLVCSAGQSSAVKAAGQVPPSPRLLARKVHLPNSGAASRVHPTE